MRTILKQVISFSQDDHEKRRPKQLENGAWCFLPGTPEAVSVRAGIRTPDSWTAHRRAGFNYFQNKFESINNEAVILDIGAGERQFKSIFEKFSNYISLDMANYVGLDLLADLTETWPLKDASFDVLVSSNTFEHLPDTVFALRECFRVLKPGGLLIVSVPFLMGIHQKPYDFVRHTNFSWVRMLEDQGFELLDFQAGGSVYDVYRSFRNRLFQQLYTAKPFSVNFLNIIWVLAAKTLHRIWKMNEHVLRLIFFKYAPMTLDITEGYLFTARKRA